MSSEEENLIVKLRNEGIGWAEVSRQIYKKFNNKRTPNELRNNYNQRLKKLYPDASVGINNFLAGRITKNKSTKSTKVTLYFNLFKQF